VPDDDALDDHIQELLDEADSVIPAITFERDDNKAERRSPFLSCCPRPAVAVEFRYWIESFPQAPVLPMWKLFPAEYYEAPNKS
jgi:hypothetical protein